MKARIVVLALFALILLSVPGGPPALSTPASATHGGGLEAGYMNMTTTVNALFASGEYADSYVDPTTSVGIYVQYSGNVLGLGLVSPGIGWIALSLGGVLVGSNYTDVVVFALDNGTLRALDEVDHGWERHLDVAIGGTDDIIAASARSTGSGLAIEFQVPVDSADDNDHHFRQNETYPISVAYNATSTDPLTQDTAHSSQLLLHIGPTPMVMVMERSSVRALSADLVVGQPSTLGGVLKDISDAPIPNQPLEFYLQTTFGLLYLGLGRTNSLGKASLAYEPRAEGTWTFQVAFRGAGPYLPANDTIKLVVVMPSAPLTPWIPTDTAIAIVVLLVVAGVWGSYLFVALQLAAIRKSGRRNLPRLPSPRGEGGDHHH